MSRTVRTRPAAPRKAAAPRTHAALFVGALVGALALTGCGAGQIAGTAEQVSAVNGSNVGAGDIKVRDAVIVYGEQVEGDAVYSRGADAPLTMTIVNEGADADRLVSASSVWAESVEVGGTTEIPGGRAVVVEGDIAVSGATAPGGAPTIAPNTAPEPGAGAQIVLTGLLDDLRVGPTYEVVLTFDRAGEVRLQVPVGNTAEPREDEPAEE